MKQHAAIGAEIIGEHDSNILRLARSVAMCHHEKWDGSGYPRGLTGEQIPLEARIIALADVFDALTSRRPYKEPWPVEKAVDLIKEQAGQHFDPALAEHFIALVPELVEIRNRWSD
jgi:putative two-component system response regulator